MKSAIVNLKTIVSGDWRKPFAKGDSIVMNNGKIVKVGTISAKEEKSCDVVLDAVYYTHLTLPTICSV